jgi:hypothetical protein
MPLNAKQSYEELSKCHQFYASFHSAYELSSVNFITVPPKTIIVSTFHDNSMESYGNRRIYMNMIDEKDYLVHSLLTNNDDIPEHHKFHNKTIYMPGSCIPNIALEFVQHDKEPMILGVFDINNVYNNEDYDDITIENNEKNYNFNKLKFINSSILPSDMINRRDLFLKNVLSVIHDHSSADYGYIIFLEGCAGINFEDTYLNRSNLTKTDLSKIKKDKNSLIDLSWALSKYNRECVLDSLQKFTSKFTFYDKSPIDFSKYQHTKYNFEYDDVYKKKIRQVDKSVSGYFNKLSDRRLSDINEEDIYYNKSGETEGTPGMSITPEPVPEPEPTESNSRLKSRLKSKLKSRLKSKKKKPEPVNVFDKYFKKEVTQILSPKKTKKSPRKIQTVPRRSSRLTSSRNVYDGRKRNSKQSSKLKSRFITLQKSSSPVKKYMAKIDNKTIHFGAKNYSDYTKHKDRSRMRRYENRHRKRENWKKSGIKSAGFWSKWILWNKPSLSGSIKDTERRFGIKIKRKK